MADAKVPVFFYGSCMNRAVLEEAQISPERFQVARLFAYDIVIAPRANLVASEGGVVSLSRLTHGVPRRRSLRGADRSSRARAPVSILVHQPAGGLASLTRYCPMETMAQPPGPWARRKVCWTRCTALPLIVSWRATRTTADAPSI